MPTPSNRYGPGIPFVQFTPSGGSAMPVTGIQSVSHDQGLSFITNAGDIDIGPTTVINDYVNPSVSITTSDAFALYQQLNGVVGTLVIKFPDAKNGLAVGGGGKIYTLANAYISTENRTQAYRQFGQQTMTFASFTSDGSTVPASLAAA